MNETIEEEQTESWHQEHFTNHKILIITPTIINNELIKLAKTEYRMHIFYLDTILHKKRLTKRDIPYGEQHLRIFL